MSPRHDLYQTIHKAIRSQLFGFATQIAAVDPADDAAIAELVAAYGRLTAFLDEHAGHEDQFVHPLVARADAALAAELEAAHTALDAQQADVAARVKRLPELVGPARAVEVERTRQAFELLVAGHLQHMHQEETASNPALWAHHGDDVLREAQGRIQGSIPPQRFGEWLQVMLPSMNLNDRAGMYLGIRHGAPPEAFAGFQGALTAILGEDGHAAVAQRAEALMAAAEAA